MKEQEIPFFTRHNQHLFCPSLNLIPPAGVNSYPRACHFHVHEASQQGK